MGEVDRGDYEGDEGVLAVGGGVGEEGEGGCGKGLFCLVSSELARFPPSNQLIPQPRPEPAAAGQEQQEQRKGRSPTSLPCNIRVQPTKHQIHLPNKLLRPTLLNHQLAQLRTHGHRLLPLDGIAVLFPGGFRACADGREGEVRVLREEEQEALADGTGGA